MSPADPNDADYRRQSADVAARFERIRQRPVILSVRNLKKSFGGNGAAHVVFDQLTIDIHRREFICAVGPSGCSYTGLPCGAFAPKTIIRAS